MKLAQTLLVFLLSFFVVKAGTVDTIAIYSGSMQKNIKCVVITPSNYQSTTKRYPVVYLLHGYGGNYSRWPGIAPQLPNKADELQFIFVCPDGGFGSWYFDSPLDSTVRYETFISKELINYVDAKYKTLADKNHRAITGLSMGGHGSLYLSIRHKDVFGAAGSMSGVVNINVFKNRPDLKKLLGDSICCATNWQKNAVINLVETLKNNELKIIFDCGLLDILIFPNRSLHQKLISLNINHDYIERPGTHNAAYWKNSIDYHLLFFKNYFEN